MNPEQGKIKREKEARDSSGSSEETRMSAPCRKSFIKRCPVEKIMNQSGLSVNSCNRKL